jgi:hypothetical protein
MKRRLVVYRDFFAGPNIAQRDEQNVAVENLHKGVRFARVIYVMRAVAATTAVETPALIDRTNAQFTTRSPAVRFGIRDFLAGVFGNLSSLFEGNSRKATFAFNRGFFDRETWRQTELHVIFELLIRLDLNG